MEQKPRICPLCGRLVRLFHINFTEKVLMCEDVNCDFPFGYEKLQIVVDESELKESLSDASSISLGPNIGMSAASSVVATAAWSQDNAAESRISVTSDAVKKHKELRTTEQKIQENIETIKKLNTELNKVKQENATIENKLWLKNLWSLQGGSGIQLLKEEEIEKLKKSEPDLKVNISTEPNHNGLINMEITTASKQEDSSVAQITVSSRIPEFWEDQPMTWFVQAEAVLYTQKLSDISKYHLLITKLGKSTIQQVTDILQKPPEANKYDTLKARLLAIYEESETRQIQKLMSEMELGDQKPSQLLRKMQGLARERFSDQALCVMWQNHLPISVRAVLAVSDSNDANVLAKIADKVVEVSNSGTTLAAVSSSSTAQASSSVAVEIAKINVRLTNMERSRSTYRGRGRGRGSSRGRSQSRRRSSTPRRTPESADWLCSYHFRYKERAHRCIEPCAWKKQQQGN